MHPNVLRLDKCSHTKAGDPNVHIAHDVDVSPSLVFMGLYFFFVVSVYAFVCLSSV